jgi:O-antigen/teichoic acid export membrane protein
MNVKRSTIYNLCGSIAAMLVSVVTVPAYLHIIGNARYGVLAIVWLFLGYFGLFDPGITRAATFHIARLHGPEQFRERESVFWTAVVVNLAFGIVGGVTLYFAARPIFMTTFKMPETMRAEVMTSLPWLAASLPVSIITGVLGGALQAREWFGWFNIINVGNAAASQLIPLAVAYWHGPNLTWLIPAVLITRAVGTIPSCVALVRALPLGVGGGFDSTLLKSLFSYGGWITISNVLGPILSTIDRMLIGSVLSAEAVAFYTVPSNLVTRVSVIPAALAASLFPRLSRSSKEDSTKLASSAVKALAAVLTPLFVLGMGALPVFMNHWVGVKFASHAAPVGLVLLAGIWVNGLAYIPYGQLQASGRPDLTAKFHAIELLPFLAILWVGLHYLGLIGAAYAWSLRVTFDALLLFVAGGKFPQWYRLLPGAAIVVAAGLLSPTSVLSIRTTIEAGILFPVAAIWGWRLSPEIRALVQVQLGKGRMRAAV